MRKSVVLKDCVIVLYSGLVLATIVGFLSLFSGNQPPRGPLRRTPQRDEEAHHRPASVSREATELASALVWSDTNQDWALSEKPNLVNEQAHVSSDCIWPEDQIKKPRCPPGGDRIISQLKLNSQNQEELFKIAVANDFSLPVGQKLFLDQDCLVNRCLITNNLSEADAIVFQNADVRHDQAELRRNEQIWIAHFLESPCNTFDKRFSRKLRGHHPFNWTASYRSDSDIVTPYAKFVPYVNLSNQQQPNARLKSHSEPSQKHRKQIERKQTRVAWFVSNCHAKNNRLEFAKQLAKFIPVDIYGKCGNLTCNRWTQDECLELINRQYKFYLAFENSNHREYITEKLYQNALGYNQQDHLLVPIVMGAPREDYRRHAPPNSFIHVDDFESAEALGAFLKRLANDTAAYYSYFRWKTIGRFVDTKFMCRLCAMLHKSKQTVMVRSISSIKDWWLDEKPL